MEAKKKKSKLFKFVKIFFVVMIFLSAVLFVSNSIWKKMGSAEWKLEMDENDIQIYSLKSPGSSVVQFKVKFQSEYTTSHFVAALLDLSLETCAEWAPVCTEVKTISPWDSDKLSKVFLTKYEFFPPIPPVEMVLSGNLQQDKNNKAVTLEFQVLPDFIPHNECCHRLKHMRNKWVWTPLDNGKTDVEFIQDVNLSELMGGYIPNYIFKLAGPYMNYTFVHDEMPKLLDKEKYYNVKFDFIEDYIEELKVAEAN